MAKNNIPIIVLFGRANVGKSTLFNKLTEKNAALVSDIEGTTRDCNEGIAEWQGQTLRLIDSGGLTDFGFLKANRQEQKKNRRSEDIAVKVQQQTFDLIKNASALVFLLDARAGLLPQDKAIALELKRLSDKGIITKNVIAVANKADNPRLRRNAAEFITLGLGEVSAISASTGSGTGDLLDLILEKSGIGNRESGKNHDLPKARRPSEGIIEIESDNDFENSDKNSQFQIPNTESQNTIDVAIIGKPNVGKSSLLNALLGQEKMIVSEIAHTTREPKDAVIDYKGKKIRIVDTAGISKSGQKHNKKIRKADSLEKFSIEKSLQALAKAQIALLVFDAHAGLTHQEAKLVEEITSRKCGLILVANKWDLMEQPDPKKYSAEVYGKLPFAMWAPLLFCSALKRQRTVKILDQILTVQAGYETSISDNALSHLLNKMVKRHAPQKAKGFKHPHIYELRQTKNSPPKFMIRIGGRDTVHFSYLRYIENRLREKFGFKGIPLTIYVEKNRAVHGLHG